VRFVALGEVAKVERTVATKEECNTLPYVGLEHIEKETGQFADSFKRQPEALLATKFKFTEKHVLYGKLRPYLNKVVLPSFEGVCTTEILPVLPFPNKINRVYLYLTLLSSEFVNWASLNVSGANLPRLDPKRLVEFKLPLPSLKEQERFAAIAQKADRLRRTRRYALQLSDTYLQSVFLEMFGDSFSNTKGWQYKEFGDIITTLTDYHANGSYEILRNHVGLLDKPDYALMIRTTDLERGDFLKNLKYISKIAYDFLGKSKLFGGEIIINKIGSAGQVYLMPYLNKPASLAMNQFLIRLNNQLCVNTYIYHLLISNYGKTILDNRIQGAVTKTITKDAIRDLYIPLPPLPLQEKFAQIVQKFERLRTQQREGDRQAEHLFQTLLHRAFRGELTPQDSNDEPASVLLEEIRAEQAQAEAEAKAATQAMGDAAEYLGTEAKQQDIEPIQLTLPGLE
jgi:type I restriction enzyme S subunit